MNEPLEYHAVGERRALRDGKMLPCTVAGRALVVCQVGDTLFALDDICTHAFARMSEGRLRGTRLVCLLHGAAFDVRDGRVLTGPASRPLAMHHVRIVDDRIEVALDPLAPAAATID
ncbi:MAG: Rieske 2Fe-2S domain-containing protein [Sinobacteraceae bacterium]|nr:Rieske 2Fe-2S domain-containing protein [Nevskiaceae bacterium]